jgi:hypothetical protein
MSDRRSPSARVINNADLLAHIASFMHFSSDPEQKAADDGYRLALLPSKTMLPSSRAKIMGVVSEWTTAEMLAYLIRRTAYIQRRRHELPAGSAMPVDLPVVAGQLKAWAQRRGDELKTLRSRVVCFKLHQIMHLIDALTREQIMREHWRSDAGGEPLFVGARDAIGSIAQAINNNIKADTLRRESAHFHESSQTLMEIIEARLTAPADDSPQGKEREQLRAARQKIDNWRKTAAHLYESTNERLTDCDRLVYFQQKNGRLKSAAAWLNEPCDGSGIPFAQFFD